jgi:hypothetical protein
MHRVVLYNCLSQIFYDLVTLVDENILFLSLGDSAELWVTLNAMGFNHALEQDEIALFEVLCRKNIRFCLLSLN